MEVKNCFILGAGMGTRMGAMGRILPKVLWPIYEKTLLELQIHFAQKWGCQNFFVNTHHLSGKIEDFVTNKNINIQILREEVLLGAGGAFFNLKQKLGSGIFLYLNCDTFYFFGQTFFNSLLDKIGDHPIVLAGLNAPPGAKYRQTLVQDGLLQGITAPPSQTDYLTYAGMGLANLGLFEEVPHPVRPIEFFASCADWRKRPVPILAPPKASGEDFEYWDFGTREHYIKSIYQVMSKKEGAFFRFLVDNHALKTEFLRQNAYRGKGRVLNFGQASMQDGPPGACLLMRPPLGTYRGEGLYCEGHFDPFKLPDGHP